MLDLVLAAILIFVVPAHRLWKSLSNRGKTSPSKIRAYGQTIAMALVLVGALAFEWFRAHRSIGSLGLDPPTTLTSLVTLGMAFTILAIFAITIIVRPSALNAEEAESTSHNLLPTTRKEMAVFIAFSFVVGCGWEILYRGYLLWLLPPHLGWSASILVAAVAYGAAHGFRNAKMFAGSLISALVFTLAFAVTHSLWWLMVIHCGLPLIGAALVRRLSVPRSFAAERKALE